MVSADNLNLDVLEEIFAYIPRGPDLPAIALVSRSFLEAVVPRLYAKISFHLRQAKNFPDVKTPFGSIVAHPDLAIHVRSVDILHVPQIRKGNILIYHPLFIRECKSALQLCRNLTSFNANVPRDAAIFLPSIKDKMRLERLCVYANFTTEQALHLVSLPDTIKCLEIQMGSWSVADILPQWIRVSLCRTLRHLTLYMITELNEDVLENALSQVPNLKSLHVIGCPKADHNVVLRVVRYTPELHNLSFSTSEVNKFSSLTPSELGSIRNLTIDSRSPDTQEMLMALFQYLRITYFPLVSFKLRAQKKFMVPFEFIKTLTEIYGHSLRRVSFLDCEVQARTIEYLCKHCSGLERLDLPLPMKEVGLIAEAITSAKNLRTIVDVDNHVQHGPRTFLSPDSVEFFMDCAPSLRTIIDGNRFWTRQRSYYNPFGTLTLERRPKRKSGTYWFLPQEV
ncbi:hypothetical protein AGABI2DRAFT_119783 [Agaricus bisporus var. bisporus H97]|uniref:hypothetical protein n=1 Tax=Agaricus bisporus var. bisporus (strain H97 / ATCC MYA-4626 / FGSC 10389) TaxID=936046 RepID=UPI00029F70FC|nr:hypothetical protein AGABI2DRAFT_119783 [Agaricus bisporus var. bisporus H97]EKV46132.1 hypothetical protein AGABI2DRAFT_119783 [Agaricus bisporus var. bisporus H97]